MKSNKVIKMKKRVFYEMFHLPRVRLAVGSSTPKNL